MIVFLVNVTAFTVFVFLGSLIMCGWYKSTRSKMIFSFWSKFWEARNDERGLVPKLEMELRKLNELMKSAVNGGNVYGAELWQSKIADKEAELENAKEVCSYKRPEFLVHPLSGCVYCYASIYGSLIYWIIGSALLKISGREVGLSWQVFVLWIAYMLSTCALNGILIKKVL